MRPLHLVALTAAFLTLTAGAIAGQDALTAVFSRPAGAQGTAVVPDQFLRAWDPVTVFFQTDQGPGEGVAEDHPERWVRLSPSHPGAWMWLDRRTLQFRPADPWPALGDFSVDTGNASVDLLTLMSPPTSMIPADGEEGLEEVRSLTLRFADALDVEDLARMISIELRPLPGVGGGDSRWLRAADFRIKALERPNPEENAAYILDLKHPIPLGMRATVHFRLSARDEQSVARLEFSTAEPFRAATMGCAPAVFPVTETGVSYPEESALGCVNAQSVTVDFSAELGALGPLEGRNLVRIEPEVPNLGFQVQGRRLVVTGDFDRERLYHLSLHPTALRDRHQRPLELTAISEMWLYFPKKPGFLRFTQGSGVLERLGPQTVPIQGRGHARVDLRIHKIDPMNRSYWPFPAEPLAVDEAERPPGPGEAPAPYSYAAYPISAGELYQQLRALGSPGVSALVETPLREDGPGADFGLDLDAHLDWLAGDKKPGTYLVGIRPLDGSTARAWMRVQVTDLALTSAEERDGVRFFVSSLATARPVAGATVRLEGSQLDGEGNPQWSTLWEGVSAADGSVLWKAPGGDMEVSLQRVSVLKGDDALVLDPAEAPASFQDSWWSDAGGAWLSWGWSDLSWRAAEKHRLAHIFSERPVYRPEEDVHLKGWARQRSGGALSVLKPKGTLTVAGPGGLQWSYPVQMTEAGGFYHRFHEEKLPTGSYQAWFADDEGVVYGETHWTVDAYRIPTFRVDLNGPEIAPSDAPFEVQLESSYYAGGSLAGRPVRWRVTPFPLSWTPPAVTGFTFASDARFGGGERFEGNPREEQGRTDERGHARLTLDPSVEATAQPRAYVVEATVTGEDDETVTHTKKISVLPPFMLGVRAPRVLESGAPLQVEVGAVGPKGEFVPGQTVTVRLKQRQWHSRLQASDFTTGAARYVTDVVDEVVHTTTLRTEAIASVLTLPVEKAGVYLVELETRDRMGRAQAVTVDLFAAGDEAVAWSKPKAGVFAVSQDAAKYRPGQTVTLVLQSPWQEAEGWVIAEGPQGNQVFPVQVRGGQGVVRLTVDKSWVPSIAVHSFLRRGRLDDGRTDPRAEDLGRPQMVANTSWVQVEPVENQVQVTLTHAKQAAPGQTIPVELSVKTPSGAPLSAEVALWLVDAAVLSLGKERRLDPLPDYIRENDSVLVVRDTRSELFGRVPYAEMPGGDGGDEEDSPLDRASVRKDFRAVPFYEPAIRVGADGRASVRVALPDNLTTFKMRAKAASGPDRFGFGVSEIAVRLPLMVQPSLPRFLRPGDHFFATSVGRLLEGASAPATAAMRAEGLRVEGAQKQAVALAEGAVLIRFPVTVEDARYAASGALERDEVKFTVALERDADRVSDAYEVTLPLQPDQRRIEKSVLSPLKRGVAVALPEASDAREGTSQRRILVTDQGGAVKLAAGAQALLEYPWGCTEQRLSRARGWLALSAIQGLFGAEQGREVVESTLRALPAAQDERGLLGYWPGTPGDVSLTAWGLEFLVEASEAGYAVDPKLSASFSAALTASLRSDYRQRVDGAASYERAVALAALARAGAAPSAYYTELVRGATMAEPEAVAAVILAGKPGDPSAAKLAEGLSESVVTRSQAGREVYGGFRGAHTLPRMVLPSEARTLAVTTRALALTRPTDPKLTLLHDALLDLGGARGWGSTQADAAALLAVRARLANLKNPARRATLLEGSQATPLVQGAGSAAGWMSQAKATPATVRWEEEVPGYLWTTLSYVPTGSGADLAGERQGFVVSRTWEILQGGGAPAVKVEVDQPGEVLDLRVGQVVEEHVQVVVPADRYFSAISIPLAAGLEPLNPRLATAPPEATPRGTTTLSPTYSAFLDDRVDYYYNHLPKGTYDFYFRTIARFEGDWIQPGVIAEDMYQTSVRGSSPGARVQITRP